MVLKEKDNFKDKDFKLPQCNEVKKLRAIGTVQTYKCTYILTNMKVDCMRPCVVHMFVCFFLNQSMQTYNNKVTLKKIYSHLFI